MRFILLVQFRNEELNDNMPIKLDNDLETKALLHEESETSMIQDDHFKGQGMHCDKIAMFMSFNFQLTSNSHILL